MAREYSEPGELRDILRYLMFAWLFY